MKDCNPTPSANYFPWLCDIRRNTDECTASMIILFVLVTLSKHLIPSSKIPNTACKEALCCGTKLPIHPNLIGCPKSPLASRDPSYLGTLVCGGYTYQMTKMSKNTEPLQIPRYSRLFLASISTVQGNPVEFNPRFGAQPRSIRHKLSPGAEYSPSATFVCKLELGLLQ